MRSEAAQNPHAQVLVRALTFADAVQWQDPTGVPVEDFEWSDVGANGLTPMGMALSMVAEVVAHAADGGPGARAGSCPRLGRLTHR